MTPGEIALDANPNDTRLAAELAAAAGEILLDLRAQVDRGLRSDDATSLRAAADAAAQLYIAAALGAARPDDAVLSEEAVDDPRRLDSDRVWIVDPLDGTREFAERADDGSWRDDFAVHVALWQRGRGVTDAAVALPARGIVHSTDAAPAARPTAAGETALAGHRLRLAVSRSRPPAIVEQLAERGDVELVAIGSAGVKAMAVVAGDVDAYVHAGGQFEWDSAAPVAVALAAGLVATRLDGTELVYNQADPSCPDLVISRPESIARLRALLAGDELAGELVPQP